MLLEHIENTSVVFEFVSAVSSATNTTLVTRKYVGGGIEFLGWLYHGVHISQMRVFFISLYIRHIS